MSSMPTKPEFNLTERPYVWLRDLARKVKELSGDDGLSFEASFSTFRSKINGLSSRLSQLENELIFAKNTERSFFGTILLAEDFIDFVIDEVDPNRYELLIFVIQSDKKTKQAYIGCDFVDGKTIRVNKAKEIPDINFKITLKEL